MMGRLKSDQGQLFYEFHLGDAVPEGGLLITEVRCRLMARSDVSHVSLVRSLSDAKLTHPARPIPQSAIIAMAAFALRK
jgi:hypothetical protein